MSEQSAVSRGGSAKRDLNEDDGSDSERSASPKRPKLEDNLDDNETGMQAEPEGEGENRITQDPPPSSFQDLLASQTQQQATGIPTVDIDDLDLDREPSPESDFPEMDHLLERMRPSKSQASKPSSQARPPSRKPRSSVNSNGGLAVPGSASTTKPVSKPKSTQTSTSSQSQNSGSTNEKAKKKLKTPELPESSNSTATTTKASRHEEHWYLDGSVVIHMQDTLFRLHRSALVRKSKYFARLFEKVDERHLKRIDSCPVVLVKGNSHDFAILLDGIDDGVGLLSNEPPFATLASILRASTVLEFESMRAWAVQSLEKMWPNKLNSVTPITKMHATESLRLARECNVPSILKRVLYEIVRKGGFGIHSVEDADEGESSDEEDDEKGEEESEEDDNDVGEASEDSTNEDEVESTDKGSTVASDEHEGEQRSALSEDDLRLLVIARERLASEWVLQALCAPKQKCASAEAHAGDASTWARLVHTSGLFEESLYDPLVGLSALANLEFSDQPYDNEGDLGVLWVNWIDENWCPDCAPRMEETFEKAKAKIWEKLDIWFAIK